MKKKSAFNSQPPTLDNIHDANALIQELWHKLKEYEDRLNANSQNSSRSPSSDTPKARAERKKLKRQVAEIRLALNQATPDINDL